MLSMHEDSCKQMLRWLYNRRNHEEARTELAPWLDRQRIGFLKLTVLVKQYIEETPSVGEPPLQHHKHLKSTNCLLR